MKRADDQWCELEYMDLSKVQGQGVYVIWKPSANAFRPTQVVRVGHGQLAIELLARRSERAVMRHGPGLLVTWAKVDALHTAGVEVYLSQRLEPIVGERFPLAVGYKVNLPLSA